MLLNRTLPAALLLTPYAQAADLPTDITSLLTTPTPPTILALGDSIHGAADIQSLRLDTTLAAIRTGRVGVVALEVNAPNAVLANAYVHGEYDQVEDAVHALGYWFFVTQNMVDFLEAVRAWNHDADDPVDIVGIDQQDAMAAWREADRLLSELDPPSILGEDLAAKWQRVAHGQRPGDWIEAGLAVPPDVKRVTVHLEVTSEGVVYGALGLREPDLRRFPTDAVRLEPGVERVRTATLTVPRQGDGPVRVRLHAAGEGSFEITNARVEVDGAPWCASPEAGLTSRLPDAPGAAPWTSGSTAWALSWQGQADPHGCATLVGLAATREPALDVARARDIAQAVHAVILAQDEHHHELLDRLLELDLALQLQEWRPDHRFAFRDILMANAVRDAVKERAEGRTVVVLAHNQHIRKDAGNTMGASLERLSTGEYVAVAVAVRRGTVRIRGGGMLGNWDTYDLTHIAPDGIEHRRRGPANRLRDWPRGRWRMRTMGTAPQEQYWFPYEPHAFDHVVVLGRTGPVVPLGYDPRKGNVGIDEEEP